MPPKYVMCLLREDAILSVGPNFHNSFSGQGGLSRAFGFMNALLLVWVASVTLLLKTQSRVSGVQIQPKSDAQLFPSLFQHYMTFLMDCCSE